MACSFHPDKLISIYNASHPRTLSVFLPESGLNQNKSGLNLTSTVVAIVWLGGGCYLAEWWLLVYAVVAAIWQNGGYWCTLWWLLIGRIAAAVWLCGVPYIRIFCLFFCLKA